MVQIPVWLVTVAVVRLAEEIYKRLPGKAQQAADHAAKLLAEKSLDTVGDVVETTLEGAVGKEIARVAGEQTRESLKNFVGTDEWE